MKKLTDLPKPIDYRDIYFRSEDFSASRCGKINLMDYDTNCSEFNLFDLQSIPESKVKIDILKLTTRAQYTILSRTLTASYLGTILQGIVIEKYNDLLLKSGYENNLKIGDFRAYLVRLHCNVIKNGYEQSESFVFPILTLLPHAKYSFENFSGNGLELALMIMNDSFYELNLRYRERMSDFDEKEIKALIEDSNISIGPIICKNVDSYKYKNFYTL